MSDITYRTDVIDGYLVTTMTRSDGAVKISKTKIAEPEEYNKLLQSIEAGVTNTLKEVKEYYDIAPHESIVIECFEIGTKEADEVLLSLIKNRREINKPTRECNKPLIELTTQYINNQGDIKDV